MKTKNGWTNGAKTIDDRVTAANKEGDRGRVRDYDRSSKRSNESVFMLKSATLPGEGPRTGHRRCLCAYWPGHLGHRTRYAARVRRVVDVAAGLGNVLIAVAQNKPRGTAPHPGQCAGACGPSQPF